MVAVRLKVEYLTHVIVDMSHKAGSHRTVTVATTIIFKRIR